MMEQIGRSELEAVKESDWDVVVVGTGMGGSTLGYTLARLGRRVLFLEKGLFLQKDAERGDGEFVDESNSPQARLLEGRWPLALEGDTSFGKVDFYAPLGCGSGGSTNLYAAQLERMLPSDFVPGEHFGKYTDANVAETWPVTFDEMLPYYRRAEQLYRVCGTPDPLNPDPEAALTPPPEASERDQFLFESFTELGLHPYRAHVGCLFKPGCSGCGATLCPRQCKSDASLICLLPALKQYGASLLAEAEVVRLETVGRVVKRVVFQHGGEEHSVCGKVVVLAAGALMTPALLLKSASRDSPAGLANGNDLVGRNLMMHTSEFIAVRPPKKLSTEGPHKAISLNDLYVRDGVKMGNLQSAGMKVHAGLIAYYLKSRAQRERKWYLNIGRVGRKVAAHVGAAIFQQANVFASVVEDLPYLQNRIVLDKKARNGMSFKYEYPVELRQRNAKFQQDLKSLLGGRLGVLPIKAGDNNLNFGHTAGTCRAGRDPRTSVVDADQRCHEVENLYIADASAFPSSGGINPSLTIAARAMQVAEAIERRL